jgi:histone H3/H4
MSQSEIHNSADTMTTAEGVTASAYDGFAPPKGAKSAWLLFTMEQRPVLIAEVAASGLPALSMTDVTKALAERFRGLSDERKAVYEEAAREDKLRHARELQVYRERHPNGSVVSGVGSVAAVGGAGMGPGGLYIPLARVRKTAKLDPEVGNINKAALLALNKATELFVQQLAKRTFADMQQSRRKGSTIKETDLISTINRSNRYRFLVRDFPVQQPLPKAVPVEAEGGQEGGKRAKAAESKVGSSARLTSFFGSTTSSNVSPSAANTL